ncbi:hypothetical protein [Lysobacter sp. H23M47]|uniref:hypothetical protein n=1 Tax=Lysobacter sp. H23M47 TaxID=2781024 RepID=UPI0018807298|nr:hypothetical protein [Lysobacter sp. H23M47]QOW24059.1 hypothetical protein INQ43_10085 [Lysobacter sp. H23M47]
MTPPLPSTGRARRAPARVFSCVLLALGVFGFAAAWVLVALSSGRLGSWMAILGAIDIVIVLRLGGWRPGPARALLAAVATACIAALAIWWIIAAHLGAMLGLTPWGSAIRLGFHHAWTLAGIAIGPIDLLWMAAAVVLAAVASR